MATLRSNLLLSTAAMLLVGIVRPAFNAIVNRTFGPEVNAHANAILAIIFISALPATAALPTAMVRHVSRALGAERHEEAAGHANLAMWSTVVAVALSSIGIVLWARQNEAVDLGVYELRFAVFGGIGYAFWRIQRTLLVALGRARASLIAELIAVLAMFGVLGGVVMMERIDLLVGALVFMYLPYNLIVIPIVLRATRGGRLTRAERRSFFRYNILWFLGSASSLATRELTLLFLVDRVDPAIVGDISVALSFMMLLAFAPRIIEVPLVHELARMGAEKDIERQRQLATKGMHWLMMFTFAAGCGASIVAEPLLGALGNVTAPVASVAFAMIALAFMIEMMMTPATNLMIAEAPPSALTVIGVLSLLTAFLWWITPWSYDGALGVVAGLALSYLVKGIGIGWYAKTKLGVVLLVRPLQKALALLVGAGLLVGSLTHHVNPYLAFVAFEAAMVGLFFDDLREIVRVTFEKRRTS